MTIFELSTLLSPLGGAIGAALAVQRAVPAGSWWLWLAIPTGLVFGFFFYRWLLRLAIGKHDKNPNMPGWRWAALLVVPFAAPYLTAGVDVYPDENHFGHRSLTMSVSFSVQPLCSLCLGGGFPPILTKTQRTQRLHREISN